MCLELPLYDRAANELYFHIHMCINICVCVCVDIYVQSLLAIFIKRR